MAAANVKLGKLAPRHDPRQLKLSRYLLPSQLPPVRQYVKWQQTVKQPWGMLLNDRIGCCTVATMGHIVHSMTAANGQETVLHDADILKAYSAISGYDPNTGANDNGAVEVDALNYFRKVGVGGHTIGAYVSCDVRDKREIQEAIYLMGACYLGVALPLAWQNQKAWNAPHFRFDFGHPAWRPGSWGGHAVPAIGYDQEGAWLVSWGELIKISWDAFPIYVDEGYALLSDDWVKGSKPAPNGFDIHALTADLAVIGQP